VFVVMVASECAPVAQAGGLGEVIFGLSRELELRGHAVEIIVPKYDCMRYDQISLGRVAGPVGALVRRLRCTARCGSGSFTAGGASSTIRIHRTTFSIEATCTSHRNMRGRQPIPITLWGWDTRCTSIVDRRDEVRVYDATLHHIECSVVEVISQPIAIEETTRAIEARGPQDVLTAPGLVGEIVNRVTDALIVQPNVW
jgi:hypothetical protein